MEVIKEQVSDIERRLRDLEKLQREDHDEFSENATKHDVVLKFQAEQSKVILERLDQQDTKLDEFKDEIFAKLNTTLWGVAAAVIAALLSGLVWAVFLIH